MIQAYHQYGTNPTIDNAANLYEALVNSANLEFINKFKYSNTDKHLTLCSNGSTCGSSTKYLFGPHPHWWLFKIERYLKGGNIGHTTTLNMAMHFKNTTFSTPKLIRTPSHPLYQSILEVDIRYDINHFVQLVYQLYQDVGPINILVQPYVVLFLLTHKVYSYILLELHNRNILNRLISINSDPFFPPSHYVYDQMINWQTGSNFYHCSYGKLHSLSIMSNEKTNLLNGYDHCINSDDVFLLYERSLCECGRAYCDLNFIPHRNNQIVKDGTIIRPFILASMIDANYLNLQFELKHETIYVYYKTAHDSSDRDITHDKEVFHAFFNQYGFDVKFIQDAVYMVGQKYPAFWKGDTGIVCHI